MKKIILNVACILIVSSLIAAPGTKLIQKFNQKPIGHTAYWIDLCSDYEYVRHAWILEAMREIRTARKIGIDLINVHANLNGMFYGD